MGENVFTVPYIIFLQEDQSWEEMMAAFMGVIMAIGVAVANAILLVNHAVADDVRPDARLAAQGWERAGPRTGHSPRRQRCA